MRYLLVVALPLLAGCEGWFSVVPQSAPANQKVVIGGLPDQRPFFGKVERMIDGQTGDFLLATCGCGEWRALVQMTDGSQWQFPVNFFTESGLANLSSDAQVYGREEDKAMQGLVQALDGHLTGDTEKGMLNHRVDAFRGDMHGTDITACVRCHVGDDPIYPRPPTHPVYVPGVTNCFDCHDVTIE